MAGLLSPPFVHKYLNGMILPEDGSMIHAWKLIGMDCLASLIVWAVVWIILRLGIFMEGLFTDQEIRDDRSVASILPASCAFFYSYALASGLITVSLQTAHSWPTKIP